MNDDDKLPAESECAAENETVPVSTPNAMDFGAALAVLRSGGRVRRAGWHGKGMWIALQVPDEHSKMTLPYLYMKTADNQLVPWLASQTDMLASDWENVHE